MSRPSLSVASFLALACLFLAGCGATVTGLGPVVRAPAAEDHRFHAADGTVLPFELWMPERAAPSAVIVALHGFNDYARAFAPAAPFWASRGIATYAYDQRGFGHSATRPLWPGRDALVDDAATFIRLVHARHPGRPLFLMGESMGGAVALLTLAAHRDLPVDGLILLAPALWRAEDIPFPGTLLLDLAAFAMPWNTLSALPGMKIRATDNREALAEMQADPLMGKDARFDTLQGLVSLMARAASVEPPMALPVLLLYGLNDDIVPFRAIVPLAERARANPRFREIWYDHGYHLLLRDRAGTRVWRDVAAFVVNPDGPLPISTRNGP